MDTYFGYTVEDYKDKYHLDENTGILFHKKGFKKGSPVGNINKKTGYVCTCLTKPDGKATTASVHRIVWIIYHGKIPDSSLVCDHINGKITDNRPCNLRMVTPKENMQNTAKRKPKKTKKYRLTEVLGVKLCRNTGKYLVMAPKGEILLETYSFNDAKYARWDWEYDNGYEVTFGVRDRG